MSRPILLAAVVALLCGGTLAAGDLEKDFAAPPDEARPWVFMWWFDKITPADVTQHMEELKSKGVGGVLLFDLGGMRGAPLHE